MYPIRFNSIEKQNPWGKEIFILVDTPHLQSTVQNGQYLGKTLKELIGDLGESLVGQIQSLDSFPLCIKYIDAKQDTKITVCPDEQTAEDLDGHGKSQAWFCVDRAFVYLGLSSDVNDKKFLKALKESEIENVVSKFCLQRGDVVYIPGGRVHGIGADSQLYQVGQNSQLEFSLDDIIHEKNDLKNALNSIHWNDQNVTKQTLHHFSSDMHHQIITLCKSPFFLMEKVDVFDAFSFSRTPKSFQIFTFLSGNGTILVDEKEEHFESGMTFLIPASSQKIQIQGRCEAIRIRLP